MDVLSKPFSALMKKGLFFCAWVLCLHVSQCMPVAQGGQKRLEDPLELELQMDVSSHFGARNQIQVLQKNSKCS